MACDPTGITGLPESQSHQEIRYKTPHMPFGQDQGLSRGSAEKWAMCRCRTAIDFRHADLNTHVINR